MNTSCPVVQLNLEALDKLKKIGLLITICTGVLLSDVAQGKTIGKDMGNNGGGEPPG